MVRWLTETASILAAYAVAGRLGQMLAAPPNYATFFWPASGIALAALLLLGRRAILGVFLGALLTNAWTPLAEAETLSAAIAAILVPASIATGATFQAIVGLLLIRRYVASFTPLTQERDIFGLLLLGGPIACLTGSSWGVTTLYISGLLSTDFLLMNWGAWWLGDTIGVVIFTPLILICLAKPRRVWRPRHLSVVLPVLVSVCTTVIGYIVTSFYQQSQTQAYFENRAARAMQEMHEQVTVHLDAVHFLKIFYAGSQRVDRGEFAAFAQELTTRHGGVQALEWLPRVRHEEREDYELRARAAAWPGYSFKERNAAGDLVTAAKRDEYFPVYYVEPYLTNEAAVGFDVASNAARRAALDSAAESGQQVATAPVTLVQETAHQPGFLVFDPVYTRHAPLDTSEQRRQAIRGYVLGVYRVRDIVDASFYKASQRDFHLQIRDSDADPGKRLIYDDRPEPSPHKHSEVTPASPADSRWATTIEVAGRTWQCTFAPTPAFFAMQPISYPTTILLAGLSFTAVLAVFLLVLAGRVARVEELVDHRTADLSKANDELAQEIVRRQQFEHALSQTHETLEQRVLDRTAELQASEARYLDLYNNAPDMFVSVDIATQRVMECNETFLATTGFARVDVIDKHVFDLYHADCLDDARRSFQQFLSTGQTQVELLLLTATDRIIEVSLNVSAVRDSEGRLLYSRAVLRDITSRKHAEERIKSQEVELAHVSRLSMMGEMATGLAHEINQPLAAITAYAEGAAVRLNNGGVDKEVLTEVIGRISADAQRAGEVIRRLRNFVKRREPHHTLVALNELVLDVIQFSKQDAKQREVTIAVDLGQELPSVECDAVAIQQVLLNFIRNGFDAMEDTPASARLLTIRTHLDNQHSVVVEVQDCGHGLSEQMEEQVFEAFFTSKEDGLGMGLAISRSIIEAHGGTILASRNTEGGATFSFSLPITTEVVKDAIQSR